VSGDDAVSEYIFVNSSYGPSATVVVAYTGAGGGDAGTDCFDQKFTFRDHYTETMHLCHTGSGLQLTEDGDDRAQDFSIVATSTTTETCTGAVYFSATANLGDSWSYKCNKTIAIISPGTPPSISFGIDGKNTYTGLETVTIMGHPVTAKHFQDVRQVAGERSGATTSGTSTTDTYFAEDGTLLQFTRATDFRYNWVVAEIHYAENVHMVLTQTPATTDGGTH
jgi:hypothetical protein